MDLVGAPGLPELSPRDFFVVSPAFCLFPDLTKKVKPPPPNLRVTEVSDRFGSRPASKASRIFCFVLSGKGIVYLHTQDLGLVGRTRSNLQTLFRDLSTNTWPT